MEKALERRLLDLGIPAELHDPASLASLFPKDYSVTSDCLPHDAMAELLAALVARGLISVRGASPAEAARRARGRHLCHFYRRPEDYFELVVPFLAAAAEAGERAVWVLPSWLDEGTARRALPSRLLGDDGLRLHLPQEVYLDASGAPRPQDAVIAFWRAGIEEALRDGYSGLRAAGDCTDAARSRTWAALESYERAADEQLSALAFTALCGYGLMEVPAVRLGSLLASHRAGLVRRGELWDELPHGPDSPAVIALLQQPVR